MKKVLIGSLLVAASALALAGGCAEVLGLEPPTTDTGGAGGRSVGGTDPGGTGGTGNGAAGAGAMSNGAAGSGGCVAPVDVAGDCHKPDCQNGTPAQVIDDSDVEDDSEPCTMDTCAQGVPMHTNLNDHTGCLGGVCSAGVCVGCIDKTDCNDACCKNQVCSGQPSCLDGCNNNDETGLDCGGSKCNPCSNGQPCSGGSDCLSGYCGRFGLCEECTFNRQCSSGICCVQFGTCGPCP